MRTLAPGLQLCKIWYSIPSAIGIWNWSGDIPKGLERTDYGSGWEPPSKPLLPHTTTCGESLASLEGKFPLLGIALGMCAEKLCGRHSEHCLTLWEFPFNWKTVVCKNLRDFNVWSSLFMSRTKMFLLIGRYYWNRSNFKQTREQRTVIWKSRYYVWIVMPLFLSKLHIEL